MYIRGLHHKREVSRHEGMCRMDEQEASSGDKTRRHTSWGVALLRGLKNRDWKRR